MRRRSEPLVVVATDENDIPQSPSASKAWGHSGSIDFTRLDVPLRVSAGATLALFIALQLPWYTFAVPSAKGVSHGSASAMVAGGWRYVIWGLALATLGVLFLESVTSFKRPSWLPRYEVLMGVAVVNLVLVLIAGVATSAVPPHYHGTVPSHDLGTSFGVWVALSAAAVAVAAAIAGRNDDGVARLAGLRVQSPVIGLRSPVIWQRAPSAASAEVPSYSHDSYDPGVLEAQPVAAPDVPDYPVDALVTATSDDTWASADTGDVWDEQPAPEAAYDHEPVEAVEAAGPGRAARLGAKWRSTLGSVRDRLGLAHAQQPPTSEVSSYDEQVAYYPAEEAAPVAGTEWAGDQGAGAAEYEVADAGVEGAPAEVAWPGEWSETWSAEQPVEGESAEVWEQPAYEYAPEQPGAAAEGEGAGDWAAAETEAAWPGVAGETVPAAAAGDGAPAWEAEEWVPTPVEPTSPPDPAL